MIFNIMRMHLAPRLQLLSIGLLGAVINSLALSLSPYPFSLSYFLILPISLTIGWQAALVISVMTALPFLNTPTFAVVLVMNILLSSYITWQKLFLRRVLLGSIGLVMLSAVFVLNFYQHFSMLDDQPARLQTHVLIFTECVSLGLGVLIFSRLKGGQHLPYTATLASVVAAFTALAVVVNIVFMQDHADVLGDSWYPNYLFFWNTLLEALLAGSFIFGLHLDHEIRSSREKYQRLVEHAPEFIYRYELGAKPGFSYVNQAVETVTSYTAAEHYADPFIHLKLTHPDDLAIVQVPRDQLHDRTVVIRRVHKDGSIHLTEERLIIVHDEQGNPVAIEGISRDVTEREQTRQQLAASEERYRAISEVMSDYAYGIQIKPDGTSEIQWITDAFTSVTGMSQEEAKKTGWRPIIHPDDFERVIARVQALRNGEPQITDFRITHKDGSVRWLRDYGQPVKNEAGQVTWIYGAARDITASKEAEEEMFRTNQTLQALIQHSPLAIIVIEIDTLLTVVWNRAAEIMFGWQAAEVIGQPLPYIPPHRREQFEQFRRQIQDGQTVYSETQRLHKNGNLVDISLSSAPLFNAVHEVTHMIGMVADISQRKQVENELYQINSQLTISRKALQRLIEQLPIGIQVFDADGLCTDVNQAHLDIFGVPERSDLVGKYNIMEDTFAVENGTQAAIQRVRGGEIVELGDIEFNFENADPRFASRQLGQRFINVTIFPVYDDQSQIINMVGMNIDVTERHQTEDLLRQRNQELQALNAIALAVGSTLNLNEVLETVLTRLKAIVPYDSASVMLMQSNRLRYLATQGIPENVYLSEIETAINDFPICQQVMEQRTALIIPDVNAESQWTHMAGVDHIRSWIGIPLIQRGTVIGVLNIDKAEPNFYTQHHAAHAMAVAQQVATAIENARLFTSLEQRVLQRTAELQEQKEQTETILRHTADAIMFTDQAANILYVNPAWEALLGYEKDEIIGLDAQVLNSGHTLPQTYTSLWETVLRGETWHGILRDRRKNGALIDLETTIVPVKDSQGEINRFVGVQRDVTEALRLEQAKSRFVSNASHELRTPLTNMMMRLYLLQKQPENLPEHVTVLETIVERMRKLVEDLLDLSRYERGVIPIKLQQVDLCPLLQEIATTQGLYANHKGITLTTSIASHKLIGMVDPERLTQVVTNLVVNAINYTPEGGVVTLHLRRENEQLVIQVEDTGPGIPAHLLPDTIFEPFCRAHETVKGTGLGLTIAREIVKLHQGTISVQSKPGAGSIFTVTLPLK